MRGNRSSAAEIEPIERGDEEETTATAVGSVSIARALLEIRNRQRPPADPYDDDDSIDSSVDAPTPRQQVLSVSGERETVPAPPAPKSDVRELAHPRSASKEDPLEHYVEALLAPAIEVDRRESGTRVRRETVKMSMRPRAATLPMIDRPITNATPTPAQMPKEIHTPPVAIVPPARTSTKPEKTKGNRSTLLGAFFVGILLALIVGAVLAFGPLHLQVH